MKIQFIAHNEKLHGANQVLLTLIKELQKRGHTIFILIPRKGTFSERLDFEKIHYNIIPYFSQFMIIKLAPRYILYPFLILFNILIFPFIILQILKNKPDMIYSNTSAENLGIIISKILNIKHISHIHEFAILDKRTFYLGGKKAKSKYINYSDGVIFVSKITASNILDGKLSNKHKIIYNGLNLPSFHLEYKHIPSNLRFGIVGTFTYGKGQDLCLKYFKEIIINRYPSAILYLIGDKNGKYKQNLLEYISNNNIENNVKVMGYMKDVDQIYSLFDILLVFSKLESFGLVTIEAMSRGVPVIGYNSSGTSELIIDKTTGYLFTNPINFEESLNSLLDEQNFNRVRFNALNIAKQKFSETVFCDEIENFLSYIYNKKTTQ